MSPLDDIRIPGKSIARCYRIAEPSHAGDALSADRAFAPVHKCLAINEYRSLARSLRGIRYGKRVAERFLTRKGLTMKIAIAAACFLAGTLVLPVAGYTADSEINSVSPKAFPQDSIITTSVYAKIKSTLAGDNQDSAVRIKVDTDNKGVVTLSGTAKTKEDADKAVSIARSVEGVAAVENNIRVMAR
jgi:hyperosmotically inducible protein